MAQISVTSDCEVPVGASFIYEGEKIGTVVECNPYHERFAVYIADVPDWVVNAIHQPREFSMSASVQAA